MIETNQHHMSVADFRTKIPRFTAPAIAGLLILSLLYTVLVTANFVLWLAVWGGVFSIGVGAYLIYLFYRLVMAVERIADSQ
jgi:hypothetical protein